MKKILMLVEGQTEEKFVKEILEPHFISKLIYIMPINLKGVSKYSLIKDNIQRLLKDGSADLVTSMLDFYALPNDFPGKVDLNKESNYLQKVEHLEKAFAEDISHAKFLPYLQLHEFEALLFCDAEPFSRFTKEYVKIQKIADGFESPEEINNSAQTAPSKRIKTILPNYNKPLHGSIIAKDIGLVKMREKCMHFDNWISNLER